MGEPRFPNGQPRAVAVLIHDSEGKYFAGRRGWTEDGRTAFNFTRADRAFLFIRKKNLANVEVVVRLIAKTGRS